MVRSLSCLINGLAVVAAFAVFEPASATAVIAEGEIHSVHVGVLAHDVPELWSGFQVEHDAADINVEMQFSRSVPFLGGEVRPAIGGTINTRGETSHAYIDARWQIDCPAFSSGLASVPQFMMAKPAVQAQMPT